MSQVIELDYPVEDGGEPVLKLSIRRPKVRDQLLADGVEGGDAFKEVHLLATLCDVPVSVIEALDIKDYTKLQQAYLGFVK